MKRKIVLLVSLACGLVAALLTRVYLSAREASIDSERQRLLRRYGTIEALVFKKDTPGGTVITKADLGILTVPKAGLRGQALTEENLADAIGHRTLMAHQKGDVLFWTDLEGGDPRERGLSADIKRQMRAVSINVSGSAGVSGMVKPNDHVDVIGTFAFPDASGRINKGDIITCTILQNVLVLATGRETAKTRAADLMPGSGYTMVTLEVSPREAEMLAFTEQMKGRLVLTLRNRNDTSYEKELPKVDFERIQGEIEQLNQKRQLKLGGR